MNIKEIKALANILSDNDLTLVEISEGDIKIKLKREKREDVSKIYSQSKETETSLVDQVEDREKIDKEDNLKSIKSPLVGVFYLAPSPDSEPFVSVGSKVKKGDVICIIEAMKLMNEITADKDGEIKEICLNNGDIAEFDQVLFKLS